jgi:hypothetical protein
MFELSGDDERLARAEAEEHDAESLIEAIFDAADERAYLSSGATREAHKEADRKLGKAIDAALTHAYAEGRADQLKDMREAEFEKAARLMNETGQGEHGVSLVTEIEQIWGLAPRRVA